jgi:hypothetical protein
MSDVNDPPVMHWYVATIILRCMIDGRESNPFVGEDRTVPAVYRLVMLLQSHSPEAAYDLALERAPSCSWAGTGGKLASGEFYSWEFAGLEDIEELSGGRIFDGVIPWGRCALGLPSSSFIFPKDEMHLFCKNRSSLLTPADCHHLGPTTEDDSDFTLGV